MLCEFAFVTAQKYRRTPAERERKNDVDEAENHISLRSRRRIPHGEKSQVDSNVDRIRVAEVQRITAHPPDPSRVDQKNDSQYRSKDRVRSAAQPFAEKDQPGGRALEMKRLENVGHRKNCEQNRQDCERPAAPGICHRYRPPRISSTTRRLAQSSFVWS